MSSAPDDPGRDPEDRSGTDYRTIAAAVGGVVLLVLFACLLWWILSQRAEVPDVVGMAEDLARAEVVKAGFTVGEVATQTALPSEAGLVLDQSPDGGRHALKGSDVSLVVAGALGVRRPGTADYTDYGTPDTGEPDIFALPPGDGREAADVQYYVAPEDLGPQVPNVQAMTESAARSALSAAGYGCVVKGGPVSTMAPLGLVYFQDPAPDAYESAGTVVTIWVATATAADGYAPPVE